MKIVIASANPKKVVELSDILSELGVTIVTAKECGFTDEIEETGTTFEENSRIKSQAVCKALNMPAIADDSGLCVEALDGRPGVYSARYADGELECCLKLIGEMQGKTDRTAKFVSSIVLTLPNGEEIVANGESYGEILDEMRGEGGFGYDPLFYVKEYDKTFAELTKDEKNRISHRGRALQEFYRQFKEKNYANK
ncbi:MAG: RdgB/HAM1 family non-canonical purine NTP pyrophosphatase [Clostridia bacterium]